MKAVIVIPTIREDSIKAFLAAWEEEFRQHTVIVVEDNPTCTFNLPAWVDHVSWNDIEEDLAEDSWIIPRRTGGIRSYGILRAQRYNPDMIVMLDDDCLPTRTSEILDGNFLGAHWRALEDLGTDAPMFDTLHALGGKPYGVKARGYPKEVRKCRTVVNHGLWDNVPDIDGETQLKHSFVGHNSSHSTQVPTGILFPLSAMNVAFRPVVLPAMYQMPMGQGQPFHRFDDIWCGWIMKKACDAIGLSVRSGSPCIEHVRASDPNRNASLEAPGILENEKVWKRIAGMEPGSVHLEGCLDEIHSELKSLGPYWVKAAEAAEVWRRLTRRPS